MSAAIFIQHATSICHIILSPMIFPPAQYFSTLSHKRRDFRGQVTEYKLRVWFSLEFFFLLILRRIRRDIIINIHGSRSIYLRTHTSGGLLWTRYLIFGFHKTRRNSWVTVSLSMRALLHSDLLSLLTVKSQVAEIRFITSVYRKLVRCTWRHHLLRQPSRIKRRDFLLRTRMLAWQVNPQLKPSAV